MKNTMNNSPRKIISEEQLAILQGLTAEQKWINPKYFYDELGSKLFEKITQLAEYYPTRTEISIYQTYAFEIAEFIEPNSVLIEPGAGSCKKIQHLLSDLKPKAYVPQDVSGEYLKKVVKSLSTKYPWLEISSVISDFSEPLLIPKQYKNESKYVFYPGSTIGNFEPEEANNFLKNMRKLMGNRGGLILGADLHKETALLEDAYNDKQGITALFNLNILKHINKYLEQKISPENFRHKAFYNSVNHRIEMHLVAIKEQSYRIFDMDIHFEENETIHTENSYKYTLEDIEKMAMSSGFSLKKSWFDAKKLFSVNLFSPIE